MAKQPKRPELTHCRVSETTHPRAPWRVFYTLERDGKHGRVFKSFAGEDAAWAFAEEKETEISNHGVRYGDIPPEVRRAFDFYRDEFAALTEAGAVVPRFEELVTAALREVRNSMQASEDSAVPVAEAVESFLAYKKSRVQARQLSDLKDRLKRFSQDFGDRDFKSITTAEIDKWLSSLRSRRPGKVTKAPLLSPLSRNHYRAVLHAIFAYGAAPARSWCPRNPVADLEPERVTTEEPQAYTTEAATRIMQTALNQKPELVPMLALGLFAGLRVSEAACLDLKKLTRDTEEFRVTGKTGPRLAPFTAACKAWLFAQGRRTGAAWLSSPRTMINEMRELFALAEVEQIDNGARHSFISYRCAESKDIARVADECGNSVSTIKDHYRQLVTGAAAKTYFSIRPEKTGKKSKITNIEAGRKTA